MSHSSQVTKVEYANKHESNITSKMANLWERKIGSDKDHKPSPTTVVEHSNVKVETMNPLPKAGSKDASSNLHRKNTREIVEAFERMASGLGSKDSMNQSVVESKNSMSQSVDGTNEKEDICKMIERISNKMKDVNDDLVLLKSRIDSL